MRFFIIWFKWQNFMIRMSWKTDKRFYNKSFPLTTIAAVVSDIFMDGCANFWILGSTQRWFNVHLTSTTLKRHWIDVHLPSTTFKRCWIYIQITSCINMVFVSANRWFDINLPSTTLKRRWIDVQIRPLCWKGYCKYMYSLASKAQISK